MLGANLGLLLYGEVSVMFISMFLGRAVSVSEQVGLRPILFRMFLGSTVSASEQVGIGPLLIMFLGTDCVLWLNVPVNNFSVMLGRSHRLLGN